MFSIVVLALLLVPATDVPVIAPAQARDHVGQEVVVEGVISDVAHSARSDATFPNMGGNYPNQAFTAVIFRSSKALFPEAGSSKGKKVRIRGVVKPYRGRAEIVLEKAEQLNVLR